MKKLALTDNFGRVHDYLRISLTERCNLRCFYCMPEEGVPSREKAEFMSAEETIEIARSFVELGVNKIRLTGGEPLIKKNFELILRELAQLDVELAITTNGILVDKFIDVFKETGLKKINVSLDSLREQRFNDISRRNYFTTIMSNIRLLIDSGFRVRINVVLIRGVNDDEIEDFIRWTQNEPIDLRFIEFMPFDGNKWNWDQKVSFKEILNLAESVFGNSQIVKLKDEKNATARTFKLRDAEGTFGVISTLTNPFCDTCNRIRLTADGKIKNCLFSQEETDLLRVLRNGEPLIPAIEQAIFEKKKERGGLDDFSKIEGAAIKNRSMTTIGG